MTSPIWSLLESWFHAAVSAVDPERAVHSALREPPPAGDFGAIIALGKAAEPMLRGAVPTGTPAPPILAVSSTPWSTTWERAELYVGDHPVPGPGSAAAARHLERFTGTVSRGDVLVLLSGGTTSLVAGPLPGMSPGDITRLFQVLHRAGLDIQEMNRIRKRFIRWGAGRLAQALAGWRILVLAISDVAGDDLETIASGPCAADSATASEVLALLVRHRLLDQLPPGFEEWARRAREEAVIETLKPDDPACRLVRSRVVARNQDATEGAAAAARAAGFQPVMLPELAGPAALAGRALARRAVESADQCLIAGGETTVALGGSSGLGGRCQELALAAALELERLNARSVSILAAGTDGRDGPTDAAGAIVDADTPARIRAAGLDPQVALDRHDAYPALSAAGALLITRPTGTNVRDLHVVVKGGQGR